MRRAEQREMGRLICRGLVSSEQATSPFWSAPTDLQSLSCPCGTRIENECTLPLHSECQYGVPSTTPAPIASRTRSERQLSALSPSVTVRNRHHHIISRITETESPLPRTPHPRLRATRLPLCRTDAADDCRCARWTTETSTVDAQPWHSDLYACCDDCCSCLLS